MRCDGCLQLFNLQDKRPRSLPCGHSACLPCLQLQKQTFCPTCKKVFYRKCTSFPYNHTAIALIEEANKNKPTPSFTLWCAHCRDLASAGCETLGHDMQSTKMALRQQVVEVEDGLDRLLQDAKAQLHGLADACGREQALDALRLLDGGRSGTLSWDVALRSTRTGGVDDDGHGDILRARWPSPHGDHRQDQLEDKLLGILALLLIKKGALRKGQQDVGASSSAVTVAVESVVESVEPEDLIQCLDVNSLSWQRPQQGREEKLALLERVAVQGVRRLGHVFGHCDPEWALQLLRAAAPCLEELDLMLFNADHLRAVLAMPRLRRLRVTGNDQTLFEQEASADVHGRGSLRWLAVESLPPVATLRLLRAHAATLERVDLSVGVGAAGGAATELASMTDCTDPCALFRQAAQAAPLAALRRVVMRPPMFFAHSVSDCNAQRVALSSVLPGVDVKCAKCDNVGEVDTPLSAAVPDRAALQFPPPGYVSTT